LTSRELIVAAISRTPAERIPLTDMSFWPETIARWEREGLPLGSDVYDHFGLDRIFIWDTDDSPKMSERALEEDEVSVTTQDSFGCIVRSWKNSYHPPVHLSYGAQDTSEVTEYMRRYDGLDPFQVSEWRLSDYRKAAARGDFVMVSPLEPAWFVISRLLGFERGLTAFVEYPEEMIAAMRRLMDYSLAHIGWLIESKGIRFDSLYFSADLCFKNGMLFSPKVYREVIQPIHREFRQFCDKHGLLLMLHCDGDVRQFIPLIIESGFQVIEPLEARAGNDVRLLKPLYGDEITFWGNIDADVIANGTKEQIRHEVISKVTVAKQGGGYIYHIDHSVPPTVSYSNYRILMETLREVA
jgi:uroporphyrinogen decarboxylase